MSIQCYNWVENGEISRKTLIIIAADDNVTCEIYAKNKNLLETKRGGKHLKE